MSTEDHQAEDIISSIVSLVLPVAMLDPCEKKSPWINNGVFGFPRHTNNTQQKAQPSYCLQMIVVNLIWWI